MKLRSNRRPFEVILVCFCIAAWFSAVSVVWSQEEGYPRKPVEIISVSQPGGANDVATRIVVQELTPKLKVPVLIINNQAAGGMMGVVMLLKAKPDGYTLSSVSTSSLIMAPLQSPNPPFDTFVDLKPICSIGYAAISFVVHKSSPFKTLEELLKYAKENPGKLTCGVGNLGRGPHFNLEILKKTAAIDIKTIPYKGPAEVTPALLGKHIDMAVQTHASNLPYLKSGEMRGLAVTAKVPNSGIRTTAEIGYPKVGLKEIQSFYVSAKTPKGIYEKLVLLFEEVGKNPTITKKLEPNGILGEYMNPSAVTTQMKGDWDSISKLVEELGLKQK